MSNKTISINPSLFSLSGSKTKKNREKKEKQPSIKPLISPNILKKQLLKRIKEHKQKETSNLGTNDSNNLTKTIDDDMKTFSDEFSDSLNYLQNLSKQKKINKEKQNYEKSKQQRREELERKTLKHYSSLEKPIDVNIELPDELREPLISVNNENFSVENQYMSLKPYVKDEVPYGVLKGGLKPTYREWNKTYKNNVVTNPNVALTIEGITKNERELRLEKLKQKLKLKNLQQTTNDKMIINNSIQQSVISNGPNGTGVSSVGVSSNLVSSNPVSSNPVSPNPVSSNPVSPNPVSNLTLAPFSNPHEMNDPLTNEIIAKKQITKKTIKRKYTLGKSLKKNSVGVMIKDRTLRKKIISAQKELKKKPITEKKNYLKNHNLIKTGSNAPNDVLNAMYESSMLAGEITNINSDTLLHNFSKDDKEF